MQRAIFLDRDNTLIHNDGDLGDPAQVRLIQGAASAVASLRGLGYKMVVVSNQGGVARGRYGEAEVEAVNRRIAELVHRQTSGATIDRFYYCPYHPEAVVEQYRRDHPWRKPHPGMILQAAKDLNVDVRQSWTVGDTVRDIQAGKAAGTYTILLSDKLQDSEAALEPGAKPDFIARNLAEAARIIAQQPRPEREAPMPARMREAAPEPPPTPIAAPEPEPPRPVVVTEPPEEPDNPDDDELNDMVNTIADTAVPQARTEKQAGQPIAAPPPPPAPEMIDPPVIAAPADAAPAPGPAAPAPPPAPAGFSPEAEVLTQILRELKRQRADFGDFSWARLFAVLIQMVTIGCVIFALFHLDDVLFFNWMFGAVFGQLAVIAALLYQVRR